MPYDWNSPAFGSGQPVTAPPMQGMMMESELGQFVQTWQLDDECFTLLAQSPPGVQHEMLSTFCPKAGTRNVKHLFLGFLSSVNKHAQARQEVSAWQGSMAGLADPFVDQSQMWSQPAWEFQPMHQEEVNDIHQFCQTWGLDEECVEILLGKPPDVQRAVLDRFRPRETTRDVKGLFKGFLKSLGSGGVGPAGRGGRAGPVAGGRAGPVGAPAARTRSYGGYEGKGYREPNSMDDVAPPLVGPGKRRASEAFSQGPPPTEQDIEQFVQAWGLDDQCAASLGEQPEDVQRHMIERFKPKVDTKDISSLFKGFLKSFVYGPGHSKRARTSSSDRFATHSGDPSGGLGAH